MSDSASDPPRFTSFEPASRFDGGGLDCVSGLLLQIRRPIDPLDSGQILEVRSTEPSVAEDLPAWCRLSGNELVSTWHDREQGSWGFLIARNRFIPSGSQAEGGGIANIGIPDDGISTVECQVDRGRHPK
jgi:5-methyltetrahydropteroyltriglutamate--homocysteine methyltransferase